MIADAAPERKFVRALCDRENARALDARLKNTPQKFHAIEYAVAHYDLECNLGSAAEDGEE